MRDCPAVLYAPPDVTCAVHGAIPDMRFTAERK